MIEKMMKKRVAAFPFFAVIAAILLSGGTSFAAGAQGKPDPAAQESLDGRMRRMEAREEIRRLLLDYGHFLDGRNFGAFSELFAKTEGEWIGGFGRAKGSPAIRELMENNIGKDAPAPPSCHLFTNDRINVHGDEATALTKWIFVAPAESGSPRMIFVGHYEDSMTREDGRWKFLRRVVHADIPPDEKIN